jgi:hypothetical protein
MNASAMPLRSGLSTGVKQGTRLSARAISMVRWAAKIEPLSDSHWTGCSADRAKALLDRAHHHVADHLAGDAGGVCHPGEASPSWQSRANATRTTSPFRQGNSSASEHQRQFDRADCRSGDNACALAGVRYGAGARDHASSSADRRARRWPRAKGQIAGRALIAQRFSSTRRSGDHRQECGQRRPTRHRRHAPAAHAEVASHRGVPRRSTASLRSSR